MKNKFSFIIVYCWVFILLCCGILLVYFADKEERISESENRMLSGFPDVSSQSIFSGEFALGFESYLSDGVWGRDAVIGVSEKIIGMFSANSLEETIMLEDISMVDELQGITGEEPTPDGNGIADSGEFSDSIPQNTPVQTETDDPSALENVSGINGYGMWYRQTDGSFYPSMAATTQQLDTVTYTLSKYKSCLPDDGMLFYCSVPLSSSARQMLYSDKICGWYENFSSYMQNRVSEGIHIVNAAELLEEDVLALENIYFTSDHHWAPRGAVIVANECLRLQGIPTVSYEEYNYTVNTFYNTIIGSKDPLELPHPLQNVTGYKMPGGVQGEKVDMIDYHSSSYMAYLCGDSTVWTKYVTGFSTGRKALVVGDSFSNAFTPYLMPYYDEVHKVDARYYDSEVNGGSIKALIEKYGIDDVYIILSNANGVTSYTSLVQLEEALYE